MTMWPQTPDVATLADSQWTQSWPQRVAISGDVIWFYLGKLIWPHPLMAIYPRWQIDAGQWFSYLPLLAAIIVLFILWLKRETRLRPVFFALAYFLVALAPFLGLISQSFWRYSFVQDHLQNLAGMGPLALAGAGLAWLGDLTIPKRPLGRSILGAGLLLVLGLLSWQRASVYQTDEMLWTDTLAKDSNSWLGHNNLGGAVLIHNGQLDEAINQFQKSLEINPSYDLAHCNLGIALLRKGRVDEAIAQFQIALEINPRYDIAQCNLGDALLQKGQVDEAMAQYEKALGINPDNAEAHNNLGNILVQKGHVDEAMIQFQKALEINPNYADAHNNLGGTLFLKGRLEEAIAQYKEALRLKPDISNAQMNLAKAQAMAAQKESRP